MKFLDAENDVKLLDTSQESLVLTDDAGESNKVVIFKTFYGILISKNSRVQVIK